ncbi:hypothetical protein J3E64_001551 [Sphingobium sp. OAS761]|uniref:hypothetical protein n=1 Tax=Sphingobium sp. OAS761 TaxID=2817901 RepID=UPI00209FF520|nr:hypothetical protein [Sphingobium sp. OAS761]MCP1469869.1 hypothetical protein [Sphingobium sp. OAS761]
MSSQFADAFRGAVAVGMMLTPLAAADAQQPNAQPVAAASVDVPLSDARNVGPNSVRFSAAQFTNTAPTIVLLGVQRESWPTIRGAIQNAVAGGYKVAGVFMGPTDAEPAFEIYAHGQLQTKPINPNTTRPELLTAIIKNVSTSEYPRQPSTSGVPAKEP